MTMKDYEETTERIKAIVQRWKQPLGLGWFRRFDVEYDNQYKEGSRDSVAECYAKWEYEEVVVTFFLPACVGKTDEELEYTIVHEIMHGVINEMREAEYGSGDGDKKCKRQHEERVCTELAQRFLWTRDFARDGHWGPKVETP